MTMSDGDVELRAKLSKALKRRRMELGHKTVKAMAEAFGISASSLAHWEGGRKLPSPENVALLSFQVGLDLPEGLRPAPGFLDRPHDPLQTASPASGEGSKLVPVLDGSVSRDGADAIPQQTGDQHKLRHAAFGTPAELQVPMFDQEFFLPVTGFARFSVDEVAIINHPALQRLGWVYQLGQTHLVYRGATHSRLEHVLGTVQVLQSMISAVNENQQRLLKKHLTGAALGEALSTHEIVFARLAALLHDVGHLPMGHTLEDELCLLPKHDRSARLRKILERSEWGGTSTPTLAEVIRGRYQEWLPGGTDPVDVAMGIVAKDWEPEVDIPGLIRRDVCRDMVGNTICADLLDYLHRDWYHIGTDKYRDERLFQYMEIRRDSQGTDRFLISLGTKPKIRSDAVSSILQLLESRYELQESVLYHRTKCSAAAMLERGVQEIHQARRRSSKAGAEGWLGILEDQLLFCGDDAAVQALLGDAVKAGAEAAIRPLSALRDRSLFKSFHTQFRNDLPSIEAGRLVGWFSQSQRAAENRRFAAELLELDAGLPPGTVTIYCPDRSMNVKLAEVRVHFDGEVDILHTWEEKHDGMLTGGHLQAQVKRFTNLWRIHVFVEAAALKALSDKRCALLHRLIECAVLGRATPGTTIEYTANTLAAELASADGSPFAGKTPSAPGLFTDQKERAIRTYPSGVMPMAAYFS